MQSVFHVAYLRGLFPDEMFRGVHMENLEGMTLNMLQPHTDDTKRMIGWIEDDVYSALEKGFLHRLHFCISSNSQGTDLIEQYTCTT
jgi:hypothetical protein